MIEPGKKYALPWWPPGAWAMLKRRSRYSNRTRDSLILDDGFDMEIDYTLPWKEVQ